MAEATWAPSVLAPWAVDSQVASEWLITLALLADSEAATSAVVDADTFHAAVLQGGRAYEDYRPQPYQFGYVAQGPDGSSSRQEVADGSGRVQGAYTITTAEGVQRKVKYAADAGGFRAVVDTNEPGTESSSPADAAFQSSQPPAAVLSARYGPGAGRYVVAKAARAYGGAALGVGGYGGLGGVGGYGVGGGYGRGAGGLVGAVAAFKGAAVHGGHGGAGWH